MQSPSHYLSCLDSCWCLMSGFPVSSPIDQQSMLCARSALFRLSRAHYVCHFPTPSSATYTGSSKLPSMGIFAPQRLEYAINQDFLKYIFKIMNCKYLLVHYSLQFIFYTATKVMFYKHKLYHIILLH